VSICIEIVSFVFKISGSQFGNELTDGQVENIMPAATLVQSYTTPDPTTRGSGRVRKFAGNGGSGRVQFGQRLKCNFEVSWYLCFILHFSFSISRVVFSVYKAT